MVRFAMLYLSTVDRVADGVIVTAMFAIRGLVRG